MTAETQAPLELRYLDPATLVPQPVNPWEHPEEQRAVLASSLDAAGWAGAALLNLETGRLIDGHLRREEAIRRGEALPTLCGRWTEAQERAILRLYNETARQVVGNEAALAALNAALKADLIAGRLAPDTAFEALIGEVNGGNGVTAPEEFPEYGEDIETAYCCPKCGYEWSGKPG